jgi:L-alanine-DL-glutamate epimerase-like enolase superfamily enzyme
MTRGTVWSNGQVVMSAVAGIDLALWDLKGKALGVPVYQLLGGAFRERIRTYNTCAGYRYVRAVPETAGLPVSNWNVERASESTEGPYEDLGWFLEDAGSLAQSLLEQGITGMKIWPLDPYAELTNGQSISNEDLRKGIEPFRKVREAVGDRIDLMVELHSLWNLPSAIRIAQALEEYEPTWFEDPIKMDNLDALARFAASTRVPTAASETLGTRWAFRELMERAGIGVVIFDPAWVGGISESKKIATMAEAWQLPIAPHDCTGPVEFAAAVHLSINAPNALVQESVRAYYSGWYRELVTEVPRVEDGWIYPLTGPGLGTQLLPDVPRRADATVRTSTLP